MHLTITHDSQFRSRLHLPARLRNMHLLWTRDASQRLQILPPFAMMLTLVLIIGQRRGHGTGHGVESQFVEADLIVGVVCGCGFRRLVLSRRCSAVLEVTKEGGAFGTEEGFESRDGGGYDADVYFEAVATIKSCWQRAVGRSEELEGHFETGWTYMAQTADWIEPPLMHVSILQLVGLGMLLIGLSRLALTLFCSRGAVGEQCGPDNGTDSGAMSLI